MRTFLEPHHHNNKSINQRDYSITNMLAFKLAKRDCRHTTIGVGRGCWAVRHFHRVVIRPMSLEPPGVPPSAPERAGAGRMPSAQATRNQRRTPAHATDQLSLCKQPTG